jgi:pimeloyl-ACP methyl ester carboxylesterase
MKTYRLSVSFLLMMLLGLTLNGPAHARGVHGSNARVYLLRGIFNVSVGLDALAGKLRQSGIAATVYGHDEEGTVAAEALQQYQAGSARPIILVGHSLGAGAAVQVARQLGASGVPVALIVLLDPESHATVPSNVGRAVNFYVSGGLGTTVDAEAGASVANLDFRSAGMDHMSIQAADSIHRQIISLIRAAAGGAAAASNAPTHRAAHGHRHLGAHHQV